MNSKYETKVFRVHTGGDKRFGFTLVGQYPCQLVRIQHGSPAEKAGLRSGDEVIEVNGVNVEDLKHNCVATFITPCSDGITELRIRRAPGSVAKTLKSGHNVQKSVSEDVYTRSSNVDDLSQVVDRVVEGFKRPDVTAPGAPSQQKGLDLSVLNSNEIASDEELKANFSPARIAIKTSMTAGISTPITLNLKLHAQNNSVSVVPRSLKLMLGYLGSIQRTVTTKTSGGLVTHLRVRKNSSVWLLLEITAAGMYLRNSSKQIIMMSPLNSFAYFGVCRENKQILALFTSDLDAAEQNSNNVIHNHVAITSDPDINCSCHVFVIDPRYCEHANHKTLMDRFQLPCDPTTGSCQQLFPTSANTVLNALQDVLHITLTQTAFARNDLYEPNVNFHGSEVEILRELGVITPQELIKSDHLGPLSSSHNTQHDEHDSVQVLCLYLQPLYGRVIMKDKETDYPTKGDCSVEICGEKQEVTRQLSGPKVVVSPYSKVNTDSATSRVYMDKDFLKPHDFGKLPRSGHKTLIHQRSHSLASNVKNTIQAKEAAAAAAVVTSAQTIETYPQDFRIGNGIRQLYHATSASVLAGSTVTGHVEGKVARWAVSFDRLLEDKTGLRVFRSFLQKEFSGENLIFWLACEKFKTLKDEKELKNCAEEIYDEHLKPCARLPVNVDSTAIKDVETNLLAPSTELFSSLQYQVYTLMKFDSYTRFLKSEIYRECMMYEMEGKPLPMEQQEEERKEEEGTSTLKRMVKFTLCGELEIDDYFSDSGVNNLVSSKFSSTKGKGRKPAAKSQASTESDESKKKSILPWRGRVKSEQQKRNTNRSSDSQASSTRSSLSSLSDTVFTTNVTNSDETLNKDVESDCLEQAPPKCNVILPNGSLMYLFCKSAGLLKEGLAKLCANKGYSLPALDVFLDGQKLTKEDLQRKLTRFINKEIVLVQKILFRLELPKDGTVGVRADEEQKVEEVLEPILKQHGLDIKEYDIFLRYSHQPVSANASVSLLHQKHVIVEEKAVSVVPSTLKPPLTAREHLEKTYAQHTPTKSITAIDHKVFEGIMTGQRQSMSGFSFDDNGVFVPMVKLQSAVSRSPALFRKKKRNVPTFQAYVEEEKKSAEELFVLLHRSQNSRMDDQRGLLDFKNIELPDFLKTDEVLKKRNNPLLVGVPSPRPQHHPLKKTISSPPSYASWINKQQGNRPSVISGESKSRQTLSRFTRNWSGSALGRGKVHTETVTETQTIDRKRFFKHSQSESAGRLRAGSLPYNPEDRCNETAGGNELRTRNRYHYESECTLNNNTTEVVWVSNTSSKNRVRASTKTDPSGEGGNESTTDDESGPRNCSEAEVIIPQGVKNADRFALSGSVVPFREWSAPNSGSPFFRDNIETARRHVHTLADQSAIRGLTSGHDREAILDNSFLREHLKPSRLFSQLSPEEISPVVTSSSDGRNAEHGTPLKCPLFIPARTNCSSTGEDFDETRRLFRSRENHPDVEPSPQVCWEASEERNDEGNVRVTFV